MDALTGRVQYVRIKVTLREEIHKYEQKNQQMIFILLQKVWKSISWLKFLNTDFLWQ